MKPDLFAAWLWLLTMAQAYAVRPSTSDKSLSTGAGASFNQSSEDQETEAKPSFPRNRFFTATITRDALSIGQSETKGALPVTTTTTTLALPSQRTITSKSSKTLTIFPLIEWSISQEPYSNLYDGQTHSPKNKSSPNLTKTLRSSSVPSKALFSPYPTTTMAKEDMFSDPIDTKQPPSIFKVREDHPIPRTGITTKGPLQTNKFYANFFLGEQRDPSYTFPYSLAWGRGKGATRTWGMACSHVEASQRVFGQEKRHGASSYFINPVGIEYMVMSAKELGQNTTLTLDSMTAFSARVNLSKDDKSPPAISFPLVQGMAYVTAIYSDTTPQILSGVYFKTVTKVTVDPKKNLSKFTFTLEDGSTWRVYAWKTKGPPLDLQVINSGQAVATRPFTGILQIAKDPMTPGSEDELDDGAGIYPVTLKLSGTASDKVGTYTFEYQRDGHDTGNLYMYALPHHVESFDDRTTKRIMKTKMQSTTKGIARLVKGTKWTMKEPNMPVDMGFSPWCPKRGPLTELSGRAKSIVKAAAAQELSQSMLSQTNLDSMYFSGKALLKFAMILYVVNDMVGDKDLVKEGLGLLKSAFGQFAANRQKFPLFYESAWGGLVSSATYVTGNTGADFGNTCYNDHHFHYGYHILAGAIIGHLDPDWLDTNKEYVNTLVRDVANPSSKDEYFPLWRSFDWYHGHSWAHGLYAATDGKNQESSSEDMMHAYALKMWGKVSDNAMLETRGNLLLSILSRSLQSYYLYQKSNTIQPKRFIGNKVAGILFENKVDHTTFFSPDIEAIQGIHMIPILAPTPFIRVSEFVKEEWDTFFSDGRIDDIRNAWKGIIYANYATIEPKEAWEFFSSKNFDVQWLDGGASLTWFLAFSAALGDV